MLSPLKYMHCSMFNNLKYASIYYKNYYMLAAQSHQIYKETYSLTQLICRNETTSKETSSECNKPFDPQHPTRSNSSVKQLMRPLNKRKLLSLFQKLNLDEDMKSIATTNGISDDIYVSAMKSFQRYISSGQLPFSLHVILRSLLKNTEGHQLSCLYSYFSAHIQENFQQIPDVNELSSLADVNESMERLSTREKWSTEFKTDIEVKPKLEDPFKPLVDENEKIFSQIASAEIDLSSGAYIKKPMDRFPHARSIKRKIIFHSGPTNSGKTYQAMNSLLKAKSGIYAGPLKMLAVEVFNKANKAGIPCDLLTGDNRIFVASETLPSNHLACTAEMMPMDKYYDVAVIDEIQLVQDIARGWAWTNALLGVAAKEVHICGESSAINIVKSLICSTGDDFELKKYKRKCKLSVQDEPLLDLKNVQPGDCIVCFSRRDIQIVVRELESLGHEVAIIYGGLPPGTKFSQAEKFNNPNNNCNILVSTDAIGMGLNLNIKRIIFYTLTKLSSGNSSGITEIMELNISATLQIAGRAGRYGSIYEEGFVTTYLEKDLATLKKLMASTPPTIEKAGIRPTLDEIELFVFQSKFEDLSYLFKEFMDNCIIKDLNFFLCYPTELISIGNILKHIDMELRHKYTFCTVPMNGKAIIKATLQKFALNFSKNIPIDYDWMKREFQWPYAVPEKVKDIDHLEDIYDAIELYFWLSYRYEYMFPDRDSLRQTQIDIDNVIKKGLEKTLKKISPADASKCQDDEVQFNEAKSEAEIIHNAAKSKSDTKRNQRKSVEEIKRSETKSNDKIEATTPPPKRLLSNVFFDKVIPATKKEIVNRKVSANKNRNISMMSLIKEMPFTNERTSDNDGTNEINDKYHIMQSKYLKNRKKWALSLFKQRDVEKKEHLVANFDTEHISIPVGELREKSITQQLKSPMGKSINTKIEEVIDLPKDIPRTRRKIITPKLR